MGCGSGLRHVSGFGSTSSGRGRGRRDQQLRLRSRWRGRRRGLEVGRVGEAPEGGEEAGGDEVEVLLGGVEVVKDILLLVGEFLRTR